MKTSSWGLEALTRSSDAAATLARLSRMLPLLSMTMPIDTGISSRRKILMVCSTLFSSTLKADSGKVVTSFPLLSSTLACTTTRRVSAVNTNSSPAGGFAGGALWPRSTAADSAHALQNLLRGSIISGPEHGPELRQASGFLEPHLDAAVLPVAYRIFGTVSQHVLVAQLDPDLCRDIGKLRQVVHGESPAAGLLGQLVQQARAVHFLERPAAGADLLENPDGINLNIGLADGVPYLRLGVAARVVTPIGDDQQSFARVLPLFHLAHPHVDAIQQRRAALGLRERQPVLDFLGLLRESLHQLRPIVEFDQEELVLGVRGLHKLRDRLPRFLQFRAHAAAGIEHDSHRQGGIFARKLGDLLLHLVFQQFEILFVQARHEPAHGVGDRHRDQHQRGIHANIGAAVRNRRPALRALLAHAGRDGNVGLAGVLMRVALRRDVLLRPASRAGERPALLGDERRYGNDHDKSERETHDPNNLALSITPEAASETDAAGKKNAGEYSEEDTHRPAHHFP